MKKILYLIFEKENNKLISDETIQSIPNVKDGLFKHFEDKDDTQLYYTLLNKKEIVGYDFICLIPNGSTLSEKYKEIISEYINEDKNKDIYLPLSLLITDDIKGILNSTLFNANFAMDFGVLDHEFALQQTDTNLFGALIPVELFMNEKHYDKNLKIYQHFHLLNSWTEDEEVEVLGIPKILINLNYDLSFKEYSEEEKIKFYKQAREKFLNKETIEQTKS
jgi:hypothetical protein